MGDFITEADGLETQEFILNLGPQHPSTHGVYRARLIMDGEIVVSAENKIGYLHRGIEKIAEGITYAQFTPYTTRFDYVSGAMQPWAWCLALEKLGNTVVPERAEYLRVIVGELQRIASHLVMLGSMVLDFSAITPWTYVFNAREEILDLLEAVSGSRLLVNYFVNGGVNADIPEGWAAKTEAALDGMLKRLDDFERMVSGNEIFLGRTKGIAPVSAAEAIEYGITGASLRASGVDFDMRRDSPYSVYDRFSFAVPVIKGGDSFDRYQLRVLEIRESVKIVRQALKTLPDGEVRAKVAKVWRPAPGEAYAATEAARGIMGYQVVSDGSTKPYRVHMRSPSFCNIGIIPAKAPGLTLQDFISFIASLDFVLGDIDR
ncbi:MAG TPA: NADPH-quinone oxidoreductase [Rectinemataceae bacterium]|nr:NADPH-quinone oxidoreductase [Rectinemataceae bacterium]